MSNLQTEKAQLNAGMLTLLYRFGIYACMKENEDVMDWLRRSDVKIPPIKEKYNNI